MRAVESRVAMSDGMSIFLNEWSPLGRPKAALVIAHGLAEHSRRYARLAKLLTGDGWIVMAPDHRGHGLTASADSLGRFPESDGFRRVRDDFVEIVRRARSAHPDIPVFIMGHSMGSLIALSSLDPLGAEVSGCVLSGVLAPPPPPLAAIGAGIARIGGLIRGVHALSPLLDKMTLGSSNDAFHPARTPFDWLSRDEAEVDAYVADPLCGFTCSFGLYHQLVKGFSFAYPAAEPYGSAPRSLPIYIFAGSADPLGGAKGFVGELEARFTALGFSDVESRVYEGARHETLNETVRDAVAADLRAWLESRVA